MGAPQHSERRKGDRDRRTLDAVWPGYLAGGYFAPEGHLHLDLVCRRRAEELARALRAEGLTSTQIRRYFGHCRRVEAKLRTGKLAWDDARPLICKLEAAAADAARRAQPKIPRTFFEFIQRNVEKIECQRDFLDGFIPHFEAIVAFGQPW